MAAIRRTAYLKKRLRAVDREQFKCTPQLIITQKVDETFGHEVQKLFFCYL